MKKPTALEQLERRVQLLEEMVLLLSRGGAPLRDLPTVFPPPSSPSTPVFTPPPIWIPLVHRNGEYPCHKPAWYLIRKFWRGEKGDLTAIRLLDGSTPEIGDAPLCGNCQRPVHPFTTQDLDFEPALVNTPSQLDTILDRHSIIPSDDFPQEGFS
jgi:hypothetical protein